MTHPRILILDYSTDQSEAAAVHHWLPTAAHVTTLFIDTAESFPDDLADRGHTHVVHTGSALCIVEEAPFTRKASAFIRGCRDRGVVQFGVCYGHQLMCLAFLGEEAVRRAPAGLEVGWGHVSFTAEARRLLGVGDNETVWQFHFDEVVEIPPGSVLLAHNSHSAIQAYVHHEQRILGTQFHPEFDREAGNTIFLREREMLAKNGRDATALVNGGPSMNAGRLFFSFFLGLG